jgi:hypothetical protein
LSEIASLKPKDKDTQGEELGAISQSTVSVSKRKLKTRQRKSETNFALKQIIFMDHGPIKVE